MTIFTSVMYGYAGLLAILTLSDLVVWNRLSQYRLLLVYEIFSGLFLATATVCFFTPPLADACRSWIWTPLIAGVIGGDIYLTCVSKLPGEIAEKISNGAVPSGYSGELLALILGAPGYLSAILLASEFFFSGK